MKRLFCHFFDHHHLFLSTSSLLNWFLLLTTLQTINCRKNWKNGKHLEKSINNLQVLMQETKFDEDLFRSILNNILIPRSVNSVGHEKVRQYIINSLQDLNPRWHIEEDVFRARTPAGKVKFRNIIATYVPDFGCVKSTSLKRTILACHYDSLYPSLVKRSHELLDVGDQFTGATDAAVSCALILYLAHTMNDNLEKIWLHDINRKKQLNTLQLVFFDGEETLRAIPTKIKRRSRNKTPQSGSQYGSRHLARKWEENSKENYKENNHKKLPHNSKERIRRSNLIMLCDGQESKLAQMRLYQNQTRQKHHARKKSSRITEVSVLSSQDYNTIDGIQLFILLDLIGGSSTRFYNTNLNTSQYFQQLIQIEKSFIELNGKNGKPFFQQNPAFMVSLVNDDHLPFVVRNVPVLHLIPHPFPRTWHSLDDNIKNLNFNSIGRFATIMQLFLLNLFHMF